MALQNIKVRVSNPFESTLVQRELFKLGYRWRSQRGLPPAPYRTTDYFLYGYNNGYLATGADNGDASRRHFEKMDFQEFVFQVGITVFEAKSEPTILLGGVEYTKRQLVEALNKFN